MGGERSPVLSGVIRSIILQARLQRRSVFEVPQAKRRNAPKVLSACGSQCCIGVDAVHSNRLLTATSTRLILRAGCQHVRPPNGGLVMYETARSGALGGRARRALAVLFEQVAFADANRFG